MPTINKNSERLVLLKNKEVYGQRSKSRNRSSLSQDNSSISIYMNQRNPYKRQKNNQLPHKIGSKYEDFLISRAQNTKEKIYEMSKKFSQDEIKECTFTP